MRFFCSKDCPDMCECRIEEEAGAVRFVAENQDFLDTPFVCRKLKDFFVRESTGGPSFEVRDGNRVDCTTEEAADRCAEVLRNSAAGGRILYMTGSGSLSRGMEYWDALMSRIDTCRFVEGGPCVCTGTAAHVEDFGCSVNPPVTNLEGVADIVLFGRNAKTVSPHLYAYLKQLKKKGKRIVYIDPIRSDTAGLANRYIRIRPGMDGVLAAALTGKPEARTMIGRTGVSEEDFNYLAEIFSRPAGIITGYGLQRYTNGKNTVQWINRLAVHTGSLDTLYYGRSTSSGFGCIEAQPRHMIDLPELPRVMQQEPFDIILVVAANPVLTFPEAHVWEQALAKAYTVVVDTNVTETAEYADLFIRAGGMFAQADVMSSYFFTKHARRGKFLDAPSDVDIVRRIAAGLDESLAADSPGEAEHIPAEPRRRFSGRRIDLVLPEEPPEGMYRLLSGSHPRYLNSQVLPKDREVDNLLFLSPEVAEKEGLAEGDMARASNNLGFFDAACRVSDMVPTGCLWVYKNRNMRTGRVNHVSPSKATDAGVGLAFYDTFVRLDKPPPPAED